MATAARRRLMRDFKRLQEDPPMGVSGAPGENNIMIWNAVIFGRQNFSIKSITARHVQLFPLFSGTPAKLFQLIIFIF